VIDVRVNQKAADRVASGHPWIYSSDVTERGGAEPGSAVRVLDPRGCLLGTAHYSSSSQIALRMLSSGAIAVDGALYLERLRAAEAHRRDVVHDTDAYRVAHGEADFLPALVVDRYADCLVMQTLSQGMDRDKRVIAGCLRELFFPRAIVARNDASVRSKETLALETLLLDGEDPGEIAVHMNGLTFYADLLRGQKTGIFLDQRENYAAVARYGSDRALDCFTSTGGFAMHLAARCESVRAIDSSAGVLDRARRNAAANAIGNIDFLQADVFDYLAASRERFHLIVLDPPAFAKSRQAIEGAARGYKEINYRAIKLLQRGGILVSCSCSHHVTEAMLLEIIAEASLDAGRPLRVLERRTQAQDHPVLLTVPETHYLKCVILQAV
jgi:23S rRNA (cytosine1962-C5)-methyltransferase